MRDRSRSTVDCMVLIRIRVGSKGSSMISVSVSSGSTPEEFISRPSSGSISVKINLTFDGALIRPSISRTYISAKQSMQQRAGRLCLPRSDRNHNQPHERKLPSGAAACGSGNERHTYFCTDLTASTICRALMPAASINSSGLPEPGMSLTARRSTLGCGPDVPPNTSSTASPRPPCGQ